MAANRDAAPAPKASLTRSLVIVWVASTVLLLAACSAAGSGTVRAGSTAGGSVRAGPALIPGVIQKGAEYCAGAPSPPVNDIPAWNSPVGLAVDWYYNLSPGPVEIESVSLVDSHNLVLRGAVVYEMRHSENPLVEVDGWDLMGRYGDHRSWVQRQHVPGAVIPPKTSAVADPGPTARDEYAVVLDVSAKTTGGGWAIGQQVTYRQGKAEHTVRSYTGYVVAPPGPGGLGKPSCTAGWADIEAAWSHP